MQASNHSRAAALHNLPVEQLSTEDLEQLLRAQDQQDPDVELICKIMEVIQEREADQPQPDVDAAWQSFREEYQGQVECYQADANITATEKSNIQHRQKHRRVLRLLATGLAAVLLLCGTAAASGFDLFTVIANWTTEVFQLTTQEQQLFETSESEYGPYADLYTAVSEYTNVPVVPTWAPDGTVQIGEIDVSDRTDGVSILAVFQSPDIQFTISLKIFDSVPTLDRNLYEIDGFDVSTLELSGVTHYIFRNNKQYGAMWLNDTTVVFIQGSLGKENILSILNSIYKE